MHLTCMREWDREDGSACGREVWYNWGVGVTWSREVNGSLVVVGSQPSPTPIPISLSAHLTPILISHPLPSPLPITSVNTFTHTHPHCRLEQRRHAPIPFFAASGMTSSLDKYVNIITR